ncbi:MAG: protein-L-isoaspartate(D-aspartate) O-methyltransferase [Pseudomonadota bacterium]
MSAIERDVDEVSFPPISNVDREAIAAFHLRARAVGLDAPELMAAVESVQRRAFVPSRFKSSAWSSRLVPIPCGEVIEGIDLQVRMIHALGLSRNHRVLEIGTGTGYCTSIMAKLASRVYTTERFKTLHAQALKRFRALKLDNVVATHADGSKGSDQGPFDRIISWAAFDSVPREFLDQLASGGEMICAIGQIDEPQTLCRLTKVGSRFEAVELEQVRFQVLTSGKARAI